MRTLTIGTIALAACLSGCADKATRDEAGAPPPAAAVTADALHGTTRLLGQWQGPEGTYLLIAGASGKYAITIRNLDGPRTFQGTAVGDTIAFERDGKLHTLRATDGGATGMKWLADKKNCVTIEPGEGYCRD